MEEIGMVDEKEMYEMLYDDYIVDKDWWVIILPFKANVIASKIECKYYTPKTEKSRGFHVIIKPLFGSICLAQKKYMTIEQLSDILGDTPKSKNSDIFCVCTSQSDVDVIQEIYTQLEIISQKRTWEK